MEEAQELNGAASRTIQALEMQLQNVVLEANSSFRDVGENLVVEVFEFSSDVLSRGLGFGAVGSNAQVDIGGSDFVVWQSDSLLESGDYENNADTLLVLPDDILTAGKLLCNCAHYLTSRSLVLGL